MACPQEHYSDQLPGLTLLLVTDHDNAVHARGIGLDRILNRDGGNVFTPGSDDKFLDAACDMQAVVLVQLSNIAAVEPTFGVDSSLGLLLVEHVAPDGGNLVRHNSPLKEPTSLPSHNYSNDSHHDVPATEADLTLALLVAAGIMINLDLDPLNWRSGGSDLEVVVHADCLRSSVLAHSVDLLYMKTEGSKEVHGGWSDGRGTCSCSCVTDELIYMDRMKTRSSITRAMETCQ